VLIPCRSSSLSISWFEVAAVSCPEGRYRGSTKRTAVRGESRRYEHSMANSGYSWGIFDRIVMGGASGSYDGIGVLISHGDGS
jgi:hypothetical protein